MPKLPQPDTNIQKQKQRKRKTVQENIDPGRPVSRPMAVESTNVTWGKMLTRQELLDLLDRLEEKKKDREMSKLSDTLKRALDKKQGRTHVEADVATNDTKVKRVKTAPPAGKKPATRSAGRGR